MTTRPMSNFRWLSPLGIGAVLFILQGILYLLIGVAGPIGIDSGPGRRILIMSNRTDTVVFGDTPETLRQTNPQLITFRSITFTMFSGMLTAAGILLVSVVWFGLRQGHRWALVVLALVNIALLPYWWLILRFYWQAGASPTLGDLPPFMWIPAALLLPAVILGWIGLR